MRYRLPVYRVSLVREGTVRADTRTIRNPRDAAGIARELLGDADREHVVALYLDTKHHALAVSTVAIGSLDAAQVHPREVFKAAILANAAAIILVHNHVSGDPEPSRADIAITRRVAHAGEILGIPLLDHVIVTQDGHVSLRERGVLPEAR